MKVIFILLMGMLLIPVSAETPFFANEGLTQNGIEWCEENYQLYQFMKEDFFEHHRHSIESRVCGNLYNDLLWTYDEYDRYEKLVERSKYYTHIEIEESRMEAQTGIIDTKPANQQEIPQVIAQQQKERESIVESKTKESVKTEQTLSESIQEETETKSQNSQDGGGCLIATATYGSEMAPQVQLLREIRDGKVMNTESGTAFMTGFNQIYYSFSPIIADWERENPAFKEMVRIGLAPMLATLAIMQNVGSESEVLGYGVAVIMMNVGIYVMAPAIVIYKIKNRV